MKGNINDIFFDGIYKEIWRKLIPNGLTEAEVDFIEDVCRLSDNDRFLDLMCGYGRHSLELARRGYRVTALDNSPDYIAEINSKSEIEGLAVACNVADVANTRFKGSFEAAICMGNSLAFFNEDTLLQLLKNLAAVLSRGAKFIINTWTIGEIAIRHFQEKTWINVDGRYKYLTENKYLFNPSRIETDSFIISPEGTMEVIKGVDYIFTISELQSLLEKSGFELKEVFSTPRKRKFTLGDARAYIVAERI